MRIEAEQGGPGETAPDDRLSAALAAQSAIWPDVPVEVGDLEPGWTTTAAFCASPAAVDEYLQHEGAFHGTADRMTCAAAMMVDYCYVFSIATVPLFVGFGIVPELSPALFAFRFRTVRQEHDGRVLDVRRAHVRFLSAGFVAAEAEPGRPDPRLCEAYRHAVEDHFAPFVAQVGARSGLARGALWRLAADGIAGRFLDAGRRVGRLEEARAAAMAIVKQPGSPLRNRQLSFFDLTLRDGAGRALLNWTFRARGGCCRFYTVAGGGLCSTCVLKPAAERNAELLQAMRRRFDAPAGPPA